MVAKDMIDQPDFPPTSNRQLTPALKRLLSVIETGEEYGPSTWFWRERIWAGEIQFIRCGRKQLLDRRDIEKFLERNKKTNGV